MKTTLSDRLSLYLPIVLMGLLALGSWWLVRSAPRPLAAQAVALPENQQDYTVEDFSTQQFANLFYAYVHFSESVPGGTKSRTHLRHLVSP